MPKLEVNPYEFDLRMVEGFLKTNKITKEQLSTYLKSLPDDASNSMALTLEEDSSSEG
jgi:hypothetical protein